MPESIFEKLGIKPIAEENELMSEVTEVIPFNIIPLDIATGVGGIPRGRLSSIVGAYSTCKSTLCGLLAKNNSRLGGTTLIIDTECTYEVTRLKEIGLTNEDLRRVSVLQGLKTKEGDEGILTLELLEKHIMTVLRVARPEDKLLIIFDTVSSIPLEAELEEDSHPEKLMGRHSKILARLFRAIPKLLIDKSIAFVAVLQPKVDLMTGSTTFLGEKPIKFHSSIIITLNRLTKDEKKMEIGFELTKNKVAPPFKKGKFIYYFNGGVDYVSSWEHCVGKSTAHYTFQDTSVLRTESTKLLAQKTTELEQLVTSSLVRQIPYKILV